MHTTACANCRKARVRCERQAKGRDVDEICNRCQQQGLECLTIKRRVGRQPGVKNKTRKAFEQDARDVGPLLSPLHELAKAASHDDDDGDPSTDGSSSAQVHSNSAIVDKYADWANQIYGDQGRSMLLERLDNLSNLMPDLTPRTGRTSIFTGRTDMNRPDGMPEHDAISLSIISLSEAQRLFDLFMQYITNGAMYLDPSLHTLSFVRSRSSFLLAVILAIASTYVPFCPNVRQHYELMDHVSDLEKHVRITHLKSIEIVQGLLLLASWSEMPTSLARDKTWLYVSHAIGLAIELRLDTALPYSVQADPLFPTHGTLLLRNAHRVCKLLFIHDRNMAMVSGRHPVYPETSLLSRSNLQRWGKEPSATRFDAPICASVSLRKLVSDMQYRLASIGSESFDADRRLIESSLTEWREFWAREISSTSEYDIIARFSTLILALSLVSKQQYGSDVEQEARRACGTLAFEVCCASIKHYKTWNGLLNSATFDTSMVAYCAMCTINSIRGSPYESDWSLFRVATLQELVSELERQAAQRHPCRDSDCRTVVDAMSKQLGQALSAVLNRQRRVRASVDMAFPTHDDLALAGDNDSFDLQIPLFDDLSHLFGMNGLPDWGFDIVNNET